MNDGAENHGPHQHPNERNKCIAQRFELLAESREEVARQYSEQNTRQYSDVQVRKNTLFGRCYRGGHAAVLHVDGRRAIHKSLRNISSHRQCSASFLFCIIPFCYK